MWIAGGRTVAFALTFLLPIVLVRRLEQAEYGLYKQFFLILSTALSLLPLGFHMSAFYFLPRETERKGQVVLNILLFHACAASLACAVLIWHPEVLQLVFRGSDLVPYGPLLGLLILFSVTAFPLEYIAIADQQPRLATAFIVAVQLVGTLLLVGAALIFGSVRSVFVAATLQGLVQLMILLVYFTKRFKAFSAGLGWSLMRSQLVYAVPLGVAGLVWSMQLQIHQYFVSNRFDAATFAIYAVGIFQVPLINILSDSVGSVMIPRVTVLQRENRPREIILLTARMLRKLAAVYFPIYAFLLISGREFIVLLFTSRYLDSWPIFAINLTMIPLAMISSAFDPIMRAYAQYRFFLLKTRLAILCVLLTALWFAADNLGLAGVVTIVVLVNLLERVVVGFKAASALGARPQDIVLLGDVGKLAGCAFGAGAITAVTRSLLLASGAEVPLVFAACILVFGSAYVGAGLLLGIMTQEERDLIEQRKARMLRLGRRGRPGLST